MSSVALGDTARASGNNSTAIGVSATATMAGALALGQSAAATGVDAIAIGHGASATGSVAVGLNASAAGGGAAFGDNSIATGALATAIGPGASASAPGSVAIGSGSVASAANSVSFGTAGHERVLTNVAPGVNPTDAVNVSQLNAAVGTGVAGLSRALKSNLFSGIAAAVALGAPATPSAPGKTTLTLQSGFFENYTGIGLAFAHRLNTDNTIPIDIQGSFAHAGSENVGRVGVSIEF
jgi:autotransporter adhesin